MFNIRESFRNTDLGEFNQPKIKIKVGEYYRIDLAGCPEDNKVGVVLDTGVTTANIPYADLQIDTGWTGRRGRYETVRIAQRALSESLAPVERMPAPRSVIPSRRRAFSWDF